VKELGLEPTTYAELGKEMAKGKESA